MTFSQRRYNQRFRRSQYAIEQEIIESLNGMTAEQYTCATNLLAEFDAVGNAAFMREMNDLTPIDFGDDDDDLTTLLG
jgi:hypothetical protein